MVEGFKDFKSDHLYKEINKILMYIPVIPDQVGLNGVILVPVVPTIPPFILSEKCKLML